MWSPVRIYGGRTFQTLGSLESLFGRKLHDPQLVEVRAPVICTLVIFFYGWGSMHAEIIYVNGADHLREYNNIAFGLISGSFTLGTR